ETLDPDMWWHLRTGETILQHGIPQQDVFSFTVSDHAWVTHEWLSQVVMWLVYRTSGLPGLILVFALLITLTFWLVYRVCAARPYLAAFITLLAAIASAIVWGARPQIFNLLLTAVFIHIVERVRAGELTPRWLWLLPPLTALWANLHSGYLLGVVLLAIYTVAFSIEQLAVSKKLFSIQHSAFTIHYSLFIIITILSFLAAALNPNGVKLWLYPFETLTSPAMQVFIQEWHSPDFHAKIFYPFGLMVALGVLSLILSRQRPSLSDLLLFGGTAAAGLISARNIPLFAIIAAPIFARHAAQVEIGDWRLEIDDQPNRQSPISKFNAIFNTVLLALAVLGVALYAVVKIDGNEEAIAQRYPLTAVDYLQSSGLAEGRGYNSYNWGGYLIWRGLPVFIDGRADVYGDDFMVYYRRTMDLRENWRDPLRDYDVDYIIMERGSDLFTLLDASGEWREVYADDVARIYIPK
ncbi:MAG: hypothetical protein KC415_16220, partial [Anaerolineales bacterium]|nr:hypothetical protein [Anaerolineales bacterium]